MRPGEVGHAQVRGAEDLRLAALPASPVVERGSSHGEACYSLGPDPGLLCGDTACVETEIFLCTSLSHEPGLECVLQEGLSINGKPVWACSYLAGTALDV